MTSNTKVIGGDERLHDLMRDIESPSPQLPSVGQIWPDQNGIPHIYTGADGWKPLEGTSGYFEAQITQLAREIESRKSHYDVVLDNYYELLKQHTKETK